MNPLVSVTWLSDRLNDSQTVVLDATLPPVEVTPTVDTRGRHLEGHIPGAMFFDIDELSDHSTSLPHMLPTEEEFSRKMAEMGVGDGMTVVVYEQTGVFSAPRAWWMLRSFGVQKVYLLDGGLEAWSKAALPVEAGPVQRSKASFTAKLDSGVVRSFEQVQQTIAARGQILDARSAGRFAGTAPEPRPGLASGHIPGARSLPFGELTGPDGRMLPAKELERRFVEAGIDLDRPVITSCGSGVSACALALGLELVGHRRYSVYDGSWAEWGREGPTETGSPKPAG